MNEDRTRSVLNKWFSPPPEINLKVWMRLPKRFWLESNPTEETIKRLLVTDLVEEIMKTPDILTIEAREDVMMEMTIISAELILKSKYLKLNKEFIK